MARLEDVERHLPGDLPIAWAVTRSGGLDGLDKFGKSVRFPPGASPVVTVVSPLWSRVVRFGRVGRRVPRHRRVVL